MISRKNTRSAFHQYRSKKCQQGSIKQRQQLRLSLCHNFTILTCTCLQLTTFRPSTTRNIRLTCIRVNSSSILIKCQRVAHIRFPFLCKSGILIIQCPCSKCTRSCKLSPRLIKRSNLSLKSLRTSSLIHNSFISKVIILLRIRMNIISTTFLLIIRKTQTTFITISIKAIKSHWPATSHSFKRSSKRSKKRRRSRKRGRKSDRRRRRSSR